MTTDSGNNSKNDKYIMMPAEKPSPKATRFNGNPLKANTKQAPNKEDNPAKKEIRKANWTADKLSICLILLE